MRAWLSIFCVAVSLASQPSAASPDFEAAPTTPPGFEIKQMNATSGARFYGVKCRTETPQCRFDWKTLCATGVARYATPSGTESSVPKVIRAPDGLSMLLFLCKPILEPSSPAGG
jgi:hypothetical protein